MCRHTIQIKLNTFVNASIQNAFNFLCALYLENRILKNLKVSKVINIIKDIRRHPRVIMRDYYYKKQMKRFIKNLTKVRT